MKTFLKILGVVIIILIGVVIYLVINANSIADEKLKKAFANLPEHITITYDDLEFNLLDGDLKFNNSKVRFNKEGTDSIRSFIEISDISILDIDYSEYLFNDQLIIESLILNNPVINHQIGESPAKNNKTDTIGNSSSDSKIPLHIGSLIIKNGSVNVRSKKLDTLVFKTNNSNITIQDVEINNTVTDLLPFTYSNYSGSTENLFVKLGDFEIATINKMGFEDYNVFMEDANIKTKYSKTELSRIITKERDWYDIHIDSIQLKQVRLERFNDTIRKFNSDHLKFCNPEVTIYRNKLERDQYKTKHYYSYGLRHLPFRMDIDSLDISNGTVIYQEKVHVGKQAGEIRFPEFYANVSNLANTNDEETKIYVTSKFMKNTPIEAQWYFKVSDTMETFTFEGDVGRFPTNNINQFSENNTFVRMEGTLNRTYFTIHGNRYQNTIRLKVNYDDFRISILDKEKGKKKKILSALANIFIKKDSDGAWKDYRIGEATQQRIYHKSFYGNLWKILGDGLEHAMTTVKKESD
ncbi:hypothetical protein [Aegicerativicinus sediminis]|uniref:hypothetical protein n=1 Tax=Aegicerativicinus sediminis TaxID=2893202 RepID=UPI001E573A27|nr:hypothetical protein [Aegicerativicinus sediminis]